MTEKDRRHFLTAFGVDLLIAGSIERGILRDDYEETNLGRVRISTNAPQVDMLPEDVERLGIDRDTAITYDGTAYLAKEFQRDAYSNWITIRMVEPA